MIVLAYKGVSLISKAIQWQTRHWCSHVAVELKNGKVVEAWHNGGVGLHDSFRTVHTTGTEVVAYSVVGADEEKVCAFLLSQVGKRYDFAGVARFISRRDAGANDKWFCSELVAAAFHAGGLDLLSRIPAAHCSPRDVTISPILAYDKTMVA